MTANYGGHLDFHLRMASILLVAFFVLSAGGIASGEEPFDEKYQKAVEAQTKKNATEETEQKQLASDRLTKYEQAQRRLEAESFARELAFTQKIKSLRFEEEARRRELEARLRGQEEKLATALNELQAEMMRQESASKAKFEADRRAFSEKFKQYSAETQLAKAEAERERKKQLAITAAMTYFTGGAALPALAAGGTPKGATDTSNLPVQNTSVAQPARLPAGLKVHPAATSNAGKDMPNGGRIEARMPGISEGVLKDVGKIPYVGDTVKAIIQPYVKPLGKRIGRSLDEYVDGFNKDKNR